MKFRGESAAPAMHKTFVLERSHGQELTFQLAPLSLSFHQKLRSKGISPPVPPVKVNRDSTGKIMRDQAGQAVTHADVTNAHYLTKVELYHQRVAVLAIIEALRDDPEVTFDAIVPNTEVRDQTGAWATYADLIFDELEAAGLTSGELIRLCEEVCRLSDLISDQITEAKANFSSRLSTNST